MIFDYEQELTTKDGQEIVATAYGTKSYDQKGEGDPAVGEPLNFMFRVVNDDFDALTSMLISLYGDDDGAGTNEELLVSKSFDLADLTTALGTRHVGIVPPGVRKKFLRAKFTITGANPTQGAIEAWLMKGANLTRANAAGTI